MLDRRSRPRSLALSSEAQGSLSVCEMSWKRAKTRGEEAVERNFSPDLSKRADRCPTKPISPQRAAASGLALQECKYAWMWSMWALSGEVVLSQAWQLTRSFPLWRCTGVSEWDVGLIAVTRHMLWERRTIHHHWTYAHKHPCARASMHTGFAEACSEPSSDKSISPLWGVQQEKVFLPVTSNPPRKYLASEEILQSVCVCVGLQFCFYSGWLPDGWTFPRRITQWVPEQFQQSEKVFARKLFSPMNLALDSGQSDVKKRRAKAYAGNEWMKPLCLLRSILGIVRSHRSRSRPPPGPPFLL